MWPKVLQHVKKVDFNPSSSKFSYQDLDLPEEVRQKIKDLLFILEKINVSESAYRELTVFCDGLPRTYLVSSMPRKILPVYIILEDFREISLAHMLV
jgi:hypothetical protein